MNQFAEQQNQDFIEYMMLALSNENSLQLLTNVLGITDKMPAGFLIYRADEEERIIYANKAILKMFNCDSLDEFRVFTGNSFRGMVHPEDLGAVEQKIKQQIDAGQHELDYAEYRIVQKGGEICWIEDYGHYVHNENVGDILCVFLNVAPRKEVCKFDENDAKRIFLSNLSHDIRTPMNAIVAYTSLAKIHIGNIEKVQIYLEKIGGASAQLLGFLNHILEISHIETEKMNIEEGACTLKNILQEVGMKIIPIAADKNIDFYVDISEMRHDAVYVDSMRLKQILSNLVDNAVKYTEDGGRVVVTVSEDACLLEGFATYRFIVEDTGVGFGKDFQDHLFEPFEREKNTTLCGVHGMGLGLAIAKNIVDIMDGGITAHSEPGKGSKFTVTLKLRLQ